MDLRTLLRLAEPRSAMERGLAARSNVIGDVGMAISGRWICARCCGSQSRGPLFEAAGILGFYFHYKIQEKLTVMFSVEGIAVVDLGIRILRKKGPKSIFPRRGFCAALRSVRSENVEFLWKR